MLLDRGELKDWFGSTEIWVEATVCGVAFYLFVVHTATATDRSFLNRDLLKNVNFIVGTVLMFLVGLIMNGTLALLPTMLQDLMNYPVLTTGLVTAPRGIGSMIAMFVVARADQPRRQPADHPVRAAADRGLDVADDRVLADDGDGAGHRLRPGPGIWPRLHLCAAEHDRAVEPAAAHHDPGNRAQQPDAQSRRQHRHRRARGPADPEHPDRAFAPGRAAAAGQPAGSRALSRRAVQPDRRLPASRRSTPRSPGRRRWSPTSTILC